MFLLLFVGWLTASGAIAGSADAAAVKTAKMAISRAVPVVGGILSDAAETPVGSLPYGMQKLVSLARLYAVDAELLLLDEPASGMDHDGYGVLEKALEIFIADGKTILLVEHNIDFFRTVADKVILLHQGQVLPEGSIDQITADKHLTEIYFGF